MRWCPRSCCFATASRCGTEQNLFTGWHDVGLSEVGEREASAAGQPAGRRDRARPAGAAHLGAHPSHPHRRAGPGRGRPELAPGSTLLAPQRAPLRRPDRPRQEGDARALRPGQVPGVAPQLRRAAAPDAAGGCTADRRRPPLPRRPARPAAIDGVLEGRRRAGAALLRRRHRPRPRRGGCAGRCGPRRGARQLDPRAADAPRRALTGGRRLLEIPTGIPFVYELDGRRTVTSSRYLGDPEAAIAAAARVARQGA